MGIMWWDYLLVFGLVEGMAGKWALRWDMVLSLLMAEGLGL